MNGRREQVWVGTFVLAAAAVLVVVILAVAGTFSKNGVPHRAYFKFAGGLSAAAPVRYGGLLAGRVETLRVDPGDSTRIVIDFSVGPDIPLKTDSVAKISSLGALGEYYLEVTTGSRDAPRAPPGSVLKSHEVIGISDLGELIGGLVPTADQTLHSINERLSEMKLTIAQVNELVGEQNRKNIGNSLATVNAMLAESRPKVAATLSNVQAASDGLAPVLKNVQAASGRLAPMLEDLNGTIKQANDTLAHMDVILVENRPDVRASMIDVRKTLDTMSEAVDLLKKTLDRNTDNLDEALSNVRDATGNMQELTDTLKRKPSLLIRGETGKDRKPGEKK
jgi:phospholipid/cholesterol/gamma-HCH transport system substrate-binding protein